MHHLRLGGWPSEFGRLGSEEIPTAQAGSVPWWLGCHLVGGGGWLGQIERLVDVKRGCDFFFCG